MSIVLDGTTGITTPGLTNTGTETIVNLTTTGNTILGDASTDTLNVGNGGLVKDASGNVGIGTSSPTEKVTSTNGFLSTGAVSSLARDGAFVDYSSTNSRFVAGRAGGNYGAWQSYVAGASGVTLRHQIDYDSTYRWYAADGTTERMRLDSSGNLLVGKTSTGFTTQGIEFRANGSSYITSTLTDTLTLYNKTSTSGDSILAGYSNVTSTAAVKFLIQASGTCLNATGTYGTYSDAKLKENIVDASSKLEKIMDLQVRNYNLIGDDLKQIGFVAQEFEQVFPSMVEETVDKDADGVELGTTTKAIKTTVLIPVLVKAIQEQQALIQSLTDRITALEAPTGTQA
jgi:hypothetical protein